jgi:nucleoside-diphosphate-sugar epimerase
LEISIKDRKQFINFVYKNKIDTFIHLAWDGIPNFSKKNLEKNYQLSNKILKYINTTNIKTVFISGSCFEYGKVNGKISENTELNYLKNSFGDFKDKIRKLYEKKLKKNKRFFWGRVFYAYGPNQRSDSLIPHIINSIKKKVEFDLRTPMSFRDYIYIDDVSSAIIKICEKGKHKIYNIGTGVPTLNYSILEKICNLKKKKINYSKVLRKQNIAEGFWADISNLNKIGWFPKYDISKALLKMLK